MFVPELLNIISSSNIEECQSPWSPMSELTVKEQDTEVSRGSSKFGDLNIAVLDSVKTKIGAVVEEKIDLN